MKPEEQTSVEIEAYYKGIAEGLRRGAWWREGKQYVGGQDKPAALEMVLNNLQQEKYRKLSPNK